MEGSGDNFLNNSNQCVRECQFGPVKQEQDAKKMKQRIMREENLKYDCEIKTFTRKVWKIKLRQSTGL